VVDLSSPRLARALERGRLARRILDPVEARALERSADPFPELWALWSAKEAAFKVVSKLLGAPPPFAHRSFGVRWQEGPGSPAGRSGQVRWADLAIAVLVRPGPGLLHAVAWADAEGGSALAPPAAFAAALDEPASPWSGPHEALLSRLTAREAEAVHHRASAAVRLAARRALAEALAVDEARLEIVCAPGPTGRRPPSLLLDGSPQGVDLSLSHHGGWIAWALGPSLSGGGRAGS